MHNPNVRFLTVKFSHATHVIPVLCGRAHNARRLPAAIGRALQQGRATAVLDYDGRARTAVERNGRYYMRVVR